MKVKHFIENNGQRIYYTLCRTRRKTIGIIVDNNGEVKIHAPYRVSEKQVIDVVQKKADWIFKKVNEVAARNANLIPRQFVSGEKFLYLGKEYTLEVLEKDSQKSAVLIKNDTITVYILKGLDEESRTKAVKDTLIHWFRQQFAGIAKDRIEKYSQYINAAPCKVVIKDQKTRWGSCSKKGNINLNWRLVMAPVEIIDYVIVHELCHLKFMNHSKYFWNLVVSVLPNCQESRKWLKDNGNRLTISHCTKT